MAPAPLAVAASSANSSPAVVTPPANQSDGWIVQLTPAAAQQAGSVDGVAKLLGTASTIVQVTSGLGMDGLVLVTAQTGTDPKAVDAVLSSNPNVALVESNAVVTASQIPNDPDFSFQWDMQNTGQTGGTPGADINATAAWNLSTGSGQVVVAVIDSGVDYNHPDLYQNIWINQAEIPASRMNNLVDVYHDGYISLRDLNNPINQGPFKITDVNNDGFINAADLLAPMQVDANGNDLGGGGWADGSTQDGNVNYPDDLIGWNFVTNTNDPMDDYGHGTHVAGTIGAEGNNGEGIAGVNWSSSIMPLEFINQYGWGWLSDAVSAINYATMMRTNLASMSASRTTVGAAAATTSPCTTPLLPAARRAFSSCAPPAITPATTTLRPFTRRATISTT